MEEEDLKVCDDGTLVQILCFWTLSIVLSLFKNYPVYFSKHSVSETGCCLRLQVNASSRRWFEPCLIYVPHLGADTGVRR
jgi:hypothetical protein